MWRHAALGLGLLASGCGVVPNPGHTEGAEHRQELRGNYLQIASCAYDRLEQRAQGLLKRADFPDRRSVRLTASEGALTYWQMDIVATAENRTAVVIPVPRTVGGMQPSSLLPYVTPCGA